MSHLLATYNRMNIAFEKGEGAWLYDTNGKKYLDFLCGIAVTALGHSHPALIKALTDQAGKLWHCSNMFEIPAGEKLATRLCENSFADYVFFTNSGAEAMECAIKMARIHGGKDKYRIIAMNKAFHGRTLTTVTAGGQDKHCGGFEPLPDGFDHVPFGDAEAVRAAITPQTTAILLESIQGEGGVVPALPEYLAALRDIADEHDLLLIFDEVQCGIGRTGKLFSYQYSTIKPDILATAKGIGGGFPMGACLCTQFAGKELVAGKHGSTFGGNPLAMAVGNAVMDEILADGFLQTVRERAAYMASGLDRLVAARGAVFTGWRGQGLMLGLQCAENIENVAVMRKLIDNGLLCGRAGADTVRLLPPLIVTEQQIDTALDILDSTAGEIAATA